MDNIEKRLLQLESQVAELTAHRDITRLIASYGPLVDSADSLPEAKPVADLWSEDGIYDIDGVGEQCGRDAIQHCYEAAHFDMVPNGTAHQMGLPVITLEGKTARALSYSCVFRPEGDRFYAWRVSANLWELKRQDNDQWVVTKRTNRLMKGTDKTLALLRTIHQL